MTADEVLVLEAAARDLQQGVDFYELQRRESGANGTSLSMIATIQGAGETPAAPTCIAAILAAPEARSKRAVR